MPQNLKFSKTPPRSLSALSRLLGLPMAFISYGGAERLLFTDKVGPAQRISLIATILSPLMAIASAPAARSSLITLSRSSSWIIYKLGFSPGLLAILLSSKTSLIPLPRISRSPAKAFKRTISLATTSSPALACNFSSSLDNSFRSFSTAFKRSDKSSARWILIVFCRSVVLNCVANIKPSTAQTSAIKIFACLFANILSSV